MAAGDEEALLDLSVHWREVSVSFGEIQALAPCSGEVLSGELTALMGPTGAGKTTLLNAMARRGPVSRGLIWYGEDLAWSRALKRHVAYVEQDDQVLANLTVRETLRFSARLRLGKQFDQAFKEARVEDVIRLLRLEACAAAKVGGGMVRGISGGERKRLVIGQEMLTDPRLLALDEPTSGLDSTTAAVVVEALRDLARSRKVAMVASIHQPSSRIFILFDKLILLDTMGVVYRGPTTTAGNAFSQGPWHMPCPQTYSASDWLMELVVQGRLISSSTTAATVSPAGDDDDDDDDDDAASKTTPRHGASLRGDDSKANEDSSSSKAAGADGAAALAAAASTEARVAAIVSLYGVHSMPPNPTVQTLRKLRESARSDEYAASVLEQTAVLLTRTWKEVAPMCLDTNAVTLHVGNAAISGAMWWQLGFKEDDIYPRFTLAFAIPIAWVFFPLLDSLGVVPKHEAQLRRELAVNTYRLSVWFGVTTTTLLVPMFVQSALYVTILASFSNVSKDPLVVVALYGVVVLAMLTFQSIGLFFSAAIPPKNLMTCAMLFVTFCFLFTGLFVPIQDTLFPHVALVNPMFYILALSAHASFGMDRKKFRCANSRDDDAGTDFPDSCDRSDTTGLLRGDGRISVVEIFREYHLRAIKPAYCVAALVLFLLVARTAAFVILYKRMAHHRAKSHTLEFENDDQETKSAKTADETPDQSRGDGQGDLAKAKTLPV